MDERDWHLDRREAVPALIGDHREFLIVAGLAGTAKDIAALTDDGTHAFCLAGAMGAATMMGLGLALTRPDKRVLVVTGDGELLMNVGSLATIASVNPANLSIVCVDNGHYGETGYQRSHTSTVTDLAQMAAGAGIARTITITDVEALPEGHRLIREGNGTSFVLLRVAPSAPPRYKRDLSPAAGRIRFRSALVVE